MKELFTERVLRERWDIARGIYDRAKDGVARPSIRRDDLYTDSGLAIIEVRVE